MKNLYGIYDKLSQDLLGGLHLFAHDAQAVRMCLDIVKDERTDPARHPSDFEMRCYGQFDPSRGALSDDQYTVVITFDALKASLEANK